MECQSCGRILSADAKFCSQCGDKVTELANDPTEAFGQLSSPEQTIQLLELATAAVKNLTEIAEVKARAAKAYRAIQDAAEALVQNKSKLDLLSWVGFGKTGQVMTQLASELMESLRELHTIALSTDNPMAEAQAKTLANLISGAIEAANIVGSYYDAPYAQLSVQQAYGQLDAVGRELASFLK
jgi:hypothetical protein